MYWLDTVLRSQFGKPSGLLGSLLIAPALNLGNIRMVNAAIGLLAPQPDASVLDIGFGGGASLWAMARHLPHGHITGVDYSRDMVADASRAIRQKRLHRRVRVKCGDVAALPFRSASFDCVLSLNSLYYWPDLPAALREIARVLKRRGRVAIGFHSPFALRLLTYGWENFAVYEPSEIAQAMRMSGFDVLQIEHTDRWMVIDTVVVLAQRAAR